MISRVTRESLETEVATTFAVIKMIEIVGEAASKVSESMRQRFPDVPWPSVIGMRNHLVHSYFDVDLDRVWTTATIDLPRLRATIENHLNEGGTP